MMAQPMRVIPKDLGNVSKIKLSPQHTYMIAQPMRVRAKDSVNVPKINLSPQHT